MLGCLGMVFPKQAANDTKESFGVKVWVITLVVW